MKPKDEPRADLAQLALAIGAAGRSIGIGGTAGPGGLEMLVVAVREGLGSLVEAAEIIAGAIDRHADAVDRVADALAASRSTQGSP
jgi:hypothetical protein